MRASAALRGLAGSVKSRNWMPSSPATTATMPPPAFMVTPLLGKSNSIEPTGDSTGSRLAAAKVERTARPASATAPRISRRLLRVQPGDRWNRRAAASARSGARAQSVKPVRRNSAGSRNRRKHRPKESPHSCHAPTLENGRRFSYLPINPPHRASRQKKPATTAFAVRSTSAESSSVSAYAHHKRGNSTAANCGKPTALRTMTS